jgi:hypothetical protein
MYRFSVIAYLVPTFAGSSQAQTPSDLVCEYKTNPIGFDVERPRLSWKIRSTEHGWVQSAYQLQVATSEEDLDSRPVWDSEKVVSNDSIHRVLRRPPSPLQPALLLAGACLGQRGPTLYLE